MSLLGQVRLLFIVCCLPLQATHVYLSTVPKCGTYLMIKALSLLEIEAFSLNGQSIPTEGVDFAVPLHLSNFLETPDLRNLINPQEKYVIMIRDPRDFFISYLHWIEMQQDRMASNEWLDIPFETRLLDGINGTTAAEFDLAFIHWSWHLASFSLAQHLKKANLPNVLFVRFEDLVGE